MRRSSITCFLFLFAASAWAQLSVNIQPGAINHAEGQVYLDETPLQFRSDKSPEVEKGQYLRTGAGKAEIQLGLVGTFWLGEQGRLRMEDSNPSDIQLFVDQGSIFVELIDKFDNQRIAIRLGDAVAELKEVGFYRLDSNPPRIRVYDGLAEILQQRKKAKVKPGKSADFIPRLKVSGFDIKQNDPWHVWAAQRSDILYGRIKKARNALLLQQRLADLARQRRSEDDLRQESIDRTRQYQYDQAVQRISEQQKAQQPPPEILQPPQK
jgi:hypothetical protein